MGNEAAGPYQVLEVHWLLDEEYLGVGKQLEGTVVWSRRAQGESCQCVGMDRQLWDKNRESG